MTTHHKTFQIVSDRRPTFQDVTKEVGQILTASGIKNGILMVYSQHTTCSVMIQEASDDLTYWGTDLLMQDLVNALEKIMPTCRAEGDYLHPGPLHIKAAKGRNEEAFWSLNTDAHLRSVLMGRSVSIPIVNNQMQLGEFGCIYFADFDQVRARERTVTVQIVGE